MAEHDIDLVTSKAGTVSAEGLKLSLATVAKGFTPNQIIATVGMQRGEALKISPNIQSVLDNLSTQASAALAANLTALSASITSARANLATQSSLVLNNMSNWLPQAQGHLSTGLDLKYAQNYAANINFADIGSGMTNFSSMTVQGLNSFGDLSKLSSVVESSSKLYDVTNPGGIGNPSDLVKTLVDKGGSSVSGLTEKLTNMGLDPSKDFINDPLYSSDIQTALNSINDPTIMNQIKTNLQVNMPLVNNLGDMTNLEKIVPTGISSGITGSLGGIGQKFKDLNASFENVTSVNSVLGGLEVPTIPTLDAAGDISDVIGGSDISNAINSLTGTGNGDLGLPNMRDFFGSAAGNDTINAFASVDYTSINVSALNSAINTENNLLSLAGIDTSTAPGISLSSATSFSSGLHKWGSSNLGGVSDMLKDMANTSNKYGDSIKASLAEGKNIQLLQQAGIRPLDFSGLPSDPSNTSAVDAAQLLSRV